MRATYSLPPRSFAFESSCVVWTHRYLRYRSPSGRLGSVRIPSGTSGGRRVSSGPTLPRPCFGYYDRSWQRWSLRGRGWVSGNDRIGLCAATARWINNFAFLPYSSLLFLVQIYPKTCLTPIPFGDVFCLFLNSAVCALNAAILCPWLIHIDHCIFRS